LSDIHPKKIVGEVSDDELRCIIIKMFIVCSNLYVYFKNYKLEDYKEIWNKVKDQVIQVYNKGICIKCGNKIKREYIGKSDRRTFYCPNVQNHIKDTNVYKSSDMNTLDKYTYTDKKIDSSNRPVVRSAKWGEIIVEYKNTTQKYKDAMIWKNGSKGWNWTLSNTHHNPGIQIPDVMELVIDHGCRFIILSTGYQNVLKVDPGTIEWLNRNKIPFKIMNSYHAIIFYNESSLDNLGMLLHSTC